MRWTFFRGTILIEDEDANVQTIEQALAYIKADETITHVYFGHEKKNKIVAFMWLEQIVGEGYPEDDSIFLPDFVDKNTNERDLDEAIQERNSWKDNPA